MGLSKSNTVGERTEALGRLGSADPVLLLASLALVAFGILGVYIAGPEDGEAYAWNQTMGFAAGLVGAVPLALIDYRKLKPYLPIIYGLALVMLLVVTVLGITINGAQSWVDIGPVQIQPSELAKLFVVVVLAGYLADNYVGRPQNFLKAAGIVALPALLVLAQPDLGTMLVFGAVFFAMVFVAGAKLYQLGALVAAGALSFAGALYFGVLKDYQIARLTTFLDPAGATDEGYQVLQSKIAIGSGGLSGKGLDAMTLGTLGFLPEDHTDFIFSNLAERLGFVGGLLLLALFFVLIWRILRIATLARDKFGVLIAVGIGTVFLFHAFINIGMTMGITPVTGIPLPFVSYGRSSLVMSVLSLGLLQSVAMNSKKGLVKPPGV